VDVTVALADRYPNFSICGLPFHISGETPDWRDLAHRDIAELEAQGMDLLLEHIAVDVDAGAREVTFRELDGDERVLGYDQLIIGTGADAAVPPVPGVDLPGVHLLRTMEDSFEVREAALEGQHAVVVGAGYIGCELVDAFRHRGLEVTLIEMAPAVMTTLDPELGEDVEATMRAHGVEVATGTRVQRIERGGTNEGDGANGGAAPLSVVTDSGTHPADIVLVAAGVTPNTDLAERAGALLGLHGAVQVDRGMRTSVDGVYAAGDCVVTWHQLLETDTWLPLGTTAHKQGRVAGENAVGGDARFAGSTGTQTVKVFELALARTGLRHDEAEEAGYQPVTIDATYDDHKAYYPGATPLRVRFTADRATGLVLGAQMVGHIGAEVSKRIDTYATAIFHRMTAAAMSDLDLSYTPPFSSPWDPVQMAAQAWEREVRAATASTARTAGAVAAAGGTAQAVATAAKAGVGTAHVGAGPSSDGDRS
jgi:NADPH-dependent 2,4-dienoyl-CoA reductase/sulfur reductase-like enzyme